MTDIRLVIFDCDGVLVDSETVIARVVAAELGKLGWRLTPEQSRQTFLGMTLADMRPLVEARVGLLPSNWFAELAAKFVAVLADGVPTMPGVERMLRDVTALGMPFRIGSNSSHEEMRVKFARTGLDRLIPAHRIHSAADVMALGGRGKPAPDLFLAAAAAEGVAPGHCLVVEDSVPGARAARAAGMACLGYAPHGGGDRLRDLGATVIERLGQVIETLAARSRVSA